jgi:hypothetical protein
VAFERFKILELKFEKPQSEGLQLSLSRGKPHRIPATFNAGPVLITVGFPKYSDKVGSISTITCY